MRPLAQREDLPIDLMVDARSALFDVLTMDTENLVDAQKLNDAIAAGESLVKILPSNHKARFKYLDALGFIKASRYNVTKNQVDIDDAISLGRKALSLVPVDDPALPNITSNLAYNLSQRHKATKDLCDLDESIYHTRHVIRIATPNRPEYHGYLLNMGSRLYLRYRITGELENCNEALAATHQVLQLSKPRSRDHSTALLNLGVFAGGTYEKTGFWKDLEEAIRLQKLCMDISTPSPESQFHCTNNLASLYDQRFARTKDISDMKEAVRYQYETVQALPFSDSMQSTRGQHLTIYLRLLTKLARATTEVSDVERAVSDAADVLNPMPEIYADLILNLQSYGDLLSRKFELSGHPMDLYRNVTGAITLASRFNQVTGLKGESACYDITTLLILSHYTLKLATEPQGNPLVVQVIEAMHKEYLKLVQTMPFIDALIKLEKDGSINVQVIILAPQSRSTEDMEKEWNEKVEYLKSLGAKTCQLRVKLVDLTLGDRPATLSADPTQKLSESLANCTFALEGSFLTEQSHLYDQYIQGNATLQAIEIAAKSSETLSNLLKGESAEQSRVLDRLSGIFTLLYEKNKVESDLLKASSTMKESLRLRPAGDDEDVDHTRTEILCQLAHKLRFRHVQTRDEKILDDSITFANEIISSVTPFNPGRSPENKFYISGKTALAKASRSKYFLNGDVENLDKAIEYVQECLKLQSQLPFSKANNSVDLVNQFALMMRSRFDEYGELRDLVLAIEHVQDFLNVKGKELPQSSRAVLTSNLGLLYEQKCERSKVTCDIQEAIKYCQRAMELAKDTGIYWKGPCINLGSALLESYMQGKNMEDLTRAVEYARMAVDDPFSTETPNSTILMDAAMILKASYQRTKDPTELEQAREYLRKSLSRIPLSHTGRATAFYHHGEALEQLHCLRPSEIAIDEAIEAYNNAFNSSSGRVSTRLKAAYSTARLLSGKRMWDELNCTLAKAIDCIKIACPTSLPVRDRQYFLSMVPGLPADTAAATLQASTPNAYQAVRSLELSRGIILGSTMDYRSEAKHLEAVSPDLFREWNHLCMELDTLSQGPRADERTTRRQRLSMALTKVIRFIRQIPSMESFSPPLPHGSLLAHQLETASPELFGTFNALQRELDSLPTENESGRRETKRQQELSSRLNGLKSTIRSIPGLEEFLLPLPEKSLLDLARRGPIFIVNCSDLVGRSDVFIIQSSGIKVLRLPMLRHEDVERWMNEHDDVIQGWTLRTFPEKNARMRDVLRWLWQTVVKPILSHLTMISDGSGATKPRVYWIGTGRLSTAPFHAAGEHENHSTENAISHVISTYVPTLRALSFAMESTPEEQAYSKPNRHLFIAESASAPGTAALPSVEEEIRQITEAASPHATVVRTPSPTPASVLSELPLANMVHFACHAISDPLDLANSHLLLHAPPPTSPSSQPDPLAPLPESQPSLQDKNKLTVRSISAARSPSAELAYLSACSAAETRKASLADESIHIASAFQLAGFRHVVGTLWQTKDGCCKDVAGEFYRGLFGRVEEGERRRRKGKWRERVEDDEVGGEEREEGFLPVAEALHDAVVKLREENPGKLLAWAPFVCFGA
ncbi:MAG: hypothetical protein Q9225_002726 [Loekoesia sp. 1 TL-2023]